MTEEKAPEKVSKELSKEERFQLYTKMNASMLDFAKWLAEVCPEKKEMSAGLKESVETLRDHVESLTEVHAQEVHDTLDEGPFLQVTTPTIGELKDLAMTECAAAFKHLATLRETLQQNSLSEVDMKLLEIASVHARELFDIAVNTNDI